MEQAYFSEIRNKIIPFLNNATDKIQVAMAWFTSSELFGALLDALNRNVDVETSTLGQCNQLHGLCTRFQ